MNKKLSTILVVVIVITFIGYIVFDVAFKKETAPVTSSVIDSTGIKDQWFVSSTFDPGLGKLKAVCTSATGDIITGGDSFVSKYSPDLKPLWTLKTDKSVTSVAIYGDTIFASTYQTIIVISPGGKLLTEWGPYEDSAIIVSVSANKTMLAFSDARNKIVTLLDKKGNVKKQIGASGEPFIIPSFYFEVDITDENMLYIANTGKSRIEIRNLDGSITGSLGEPGTAPGAFCGCCNPSHFTRIPEGFITAEKGINRIKIINKKGEFVEFVSSVNKFMPPVPLDVASPDGKIIYAANPADSKLYIFKRRS